MNNNILTIQEQLMSQLEEKDKEIERLQQENKQLLLENTKLYEDISRAIKIL